MAHPDCNTHRAVTEKEEEGGGQAETAQNSCASLTCGILARPLGVFVQGAHDITHGSGDPHLMLLAVVRLQELVIRQRE